MRGQWIVMISMLVAVMALSGMGSPAQTASVTTSDRSGRPLVTLYTHDLGFVRETRTVSGDTLRLEDVPERIDVASIRLVPESGRITRLAYRFDVASGDGLLENARGARVRVTLRGDRAVEGTLASADGNWIVVRSVDGRLSTLSRTAVDGVELLDGTRRLSARPAIEAVIEGGRAPAPMHAELSYLTGGLSWAAEHTLVRTGETQGTWSSDVTVENTTGRDFRDARVELVAGEPRRESPRPPMPYEMRALAAPTAVAGKAADLTEETFSEYHLYTLDHPATLRQQETQKLSMLEPRRITYAPRYLYRATDGGGVRTQLELVNDSGAGLGVPLPAGRVRVYEPNGRGDLEFTGEATIGHTPAGEKLTLDVGQAFDLVGERREVSTTRISDREREATVEIKLRNQKSTPVTIIVEELVSGDVQILQASIEPTKKDANTLQFRVPVAAGKQTIVTYTARYRY